MYQGLIGKKALAGFGVASLCLGLCLNEAQKQQKERKNAKFFTGLQRNTRTVITAGKILNNYWWATRKRKANGNHPAIDLEPEQWKKLHQYAAEQLLKLFRANGGIYIKFGQHLASIDYLIPEEFCETMKCLFQEAPISPNAHVDKVIELELGKSKEEIFCDFQPVPIGAASLAQVHQARIKETGELVAVKVQHLNLRQYAENDIKISAFLFGKIKYFFPEFEFAWLSKEMQSSIPREMDFQQEAENAKKMHHFLQQDPKLKEQVYIPKVYEELSTSRLLVMELARGLPVCDLQELHKNQISPKKLCQLISKVFCKMIFDFHLLHCDPHPGNMLVQPLGRGKFRLILLDHGLYREIPPDLVGKYASLWKNLLFFNEAALKDICRSLGISSDNYRTLSSILSQSTWTFLSSRNIFIHKQQRNLQEFQRKSIEHFAAILQVLSSVPRELLLIFKTNDILRSLERKITGSFVQKYYLRATLSHSLAFLWHQPCKLWQRLVLAFEIGIFHIGCWLI